ncbi:MAG: STAS domain-containing protein [Polyangiales bacterium]
MKQKLVATVEERRSGANLVRLTGTLDEHNELDEITDQVVGAEALINLSGVERINSSGTRDWVNWLKGLEARGVRPTLVACSPAVVTQLNLVKNFAGRAIVKSFQAPYHCDACTLDKLLLINVSEMRGRATAPPCTCDGCGKAMVLADETGTYFSFVDHVIDTKPVAKIDPAELARGSNASVVEDETSGSRPSGSRLTPSSPYLSAFQVGRTPSKGHIKFERPSHRTLPPPQKPAGERSYLIAIVLLMVCTIGVLLFLLAR